MNELHSNEQYFFDSDTLNQLSTFLESWENPCSICCPMLGKELESRGVDVTILDIDERFAFLNGFQKNDLGGLPGLFQLLSTLLRTLLIMY